MKRGDLVTIAASGDYGKPRPALVVQADRFQGHSSLTVLPLTSDLHDVPRLRITVEPGRGTGLRHTSQVMVDKIITVAHARAGQRIGQLDTASLASVDQALAAFLGLA